MSPANLFTVLIHDILSGVGVLHSQSQTQSQSQSRSHSVISNINAFKSKLDEINVEELVKKLKKGSFQNSNTPTPMCILCNSAFLSHLHNVVHHMDHILHLVCI